MFEKKVDGERKVEILGGGINTCLHVTDSLNYVNDSIRNNLVISNWEIENYKELDKLKQDIIAIARSVNFDSNSVIIIYGIEISKLTEVKEGELEIENKTPGCDKNGNCIDTMLPQSFGVSYYVIKGNYQKVTLKKWNMI